MPTSEAKPIKTNIIAKRAPSLEGHFNQFHIDECVATCDPESPLPRTMIYAKKALAFAGSLLLFIGCASNPYSKFYRSTPIAADVLLPYSGNTEIFPTPVNQVSATVEELERRGYVAIGQSFFEAGSQVTQEQILAQAKKVGADIVITTGKFIGSQTVSVPQMVTTPGQTTTINSAGTVKANAYGSSTSTYTTPYGTAVGTTYGSAAGSGSYSDSTTITTSPTTQFQTIQQSVDRFSFSAGFFRKRSFMFGAYCGALPQEVRERLQRNSGVYVAKVVDNTPAFDANILRGDILLTFNGKDIPGPDRFADLYSSTPNEEVEIRLLRGAEERIVKVKIGPLPKNPSNDR
jgi:PDZ domain